MAFNLVLVEMFGHEVCVVEVTVNLGQIHEVPRGLLLEPEQVHIDVANLGEARPLQDALGCARVQQQGRAILFAEVSQKAKHSETFARGFNHGVKLTFGAGLSNNSLSFAPRVDTMQAHMYGPTGCRLPGSAAAGPIGV